MTKQVSMIAATAESVAVAYVALIEAGEALSSVKFDAIVSMAASVALRLRVEYINALEGGEQLETTKKGELVALRDLSKAQRDAFVAAFVKAGIGDKDAANIASMGRTVARVFIPHMVETGSIRTAKSGDDMAEMIRQSLLDLTDGKASYNELEKARARGWEAVEEEAAQADDADAAEDTAPEAKADVDMSATIESAPEQAPPLSPSDALDDEVSNALQALRAAVQRDDWERLNAAGFGSFLTEAREAHKAFIEANAEAEKALNG